MSRYAGLVLVAALLMAGCDKQLKPGAMPDVSKVLTQVDACMQAGDTNGALKVLTNAMDDKSFKLQRSWFFGNVLRVLIVADRANEAEAKYLEVIGKDDELTRVGFDVMCGYHQQKGPEAFESWIKGMTEARLPKDVQVRSYALYMGVLRAKNQFDKVLEQATICIKKFDAATSRKLFEDVLAGELAAGNFDNAGKLLATIEKDGAAVPELQYLVAIQRTDIMFLRGNWQEAEPQFIKVAASLPDGELVVCFQRVMSRCLGQKQMDLADRLCDHLLKNEKGKAAARREAAMQWIETAKARKDVAAIPVRLEALRGMGVDSQVLFAIVQNEFYTVLSGGKKDSIVAMGAYCESLEPLFDRDEDKAQLRAMALDGSFITEDYAHSIKILETGIPGRDKTWHEMALVKARAHLALKEGKPKEAVEHFRKFMESVAKWDKPEQDPMTGIFYSKEMCLGRNAKRIGDIWAGAGDQKAAADAYAEAKQYYAKALADVRPESKEAEIIKGEVAGIAMPPPAPPAAAPVAAPAPAPAKPEDK